MKNLEVVFIDDEKDLCELYPLYFNLDNINVHTFECPREAIDYIKSNAVDMCFIDYRMPKIDGFQCRKEIPDSIPCYLLTGELDIVTDDSFIEVLEKPLEIKKFNIIISKFEKSG